MTTPFHKLFKKTETVANSGTSEGVQKSWETRHRGESGPAKDDYERDEDRQHFNHMQEVEKAPLAERKEAEKDTMDHLKDPESFAQRAEWLHQGNYGHGAMRAAHRILAAPRMNREAALTQLTAAYEHRSPGRHTVAAWKKLSPEEQKNLSTHMQGVIKGWEEEHPAPSKG